MLIVANSYIAVPRNPLVQRVAVPEGPDAADDWIVEQAGPGDVVVTADVTLAHRCVIAGAQVLAPNGRVFTKAAIGMALAMRNLMDQLRSADEVTSGSKPFSSRDRSNFLQALEQVVRRSKK